MIQYSLLRQDYFFAFVFFIAVALFSGSVYSQGFLEMPSITEVPEYERESMLLDLDIPAVRDRDPDPEAGPRLNVKEFRIQGLVEFPELGITREALIKQVESIRFDMMKEGRRTESGFTLDELAELSHLIIEVEKDTQERHVNQLDFQKFVFLVREQLRKRGMTLGMIETVADTITRYYRERGFMLAKAYIPKQEVRDGIVNLTLLLGDLAEVRVVDNKHVSPKLIERTFDSDIDEPVTSWKVEESMYLINDIPGVSAQAYFKPGDQVGDTKMRVKVDTEKWYSANIRLDNHGTEATSENRAYVDFYWNNPMGWGDQLYIAALNSYDPNNSTYGAIRYNSFLFNPRWRSSIGYSTNEFYSRFLRADGNPTVQGESRVFDTSLSYHFKRTRIKNYSLELKYMNIDTFIDSSGLEDPNVVKKVSLGFNFDVLNQRRRQLYIGDVTIHSGSAPVSDNLIDEQTTNTFVSANLTTLSFFKIPFTRYTTRFLTKTSAQYAGKSISNLNQLTLSGTSRARGFSSNAYQADDGVYAGVDWIFPMPDFGNAEWFGEPVKNIFQPYLFVDGSWGKTHPFEGSDIESDPIYGRLSNLGGGVRINIGQLSGSFSGAKAESSRIDGLQDRIEEKKFIFELQYKL